MNTQATTKSDDSLILSYTGIAPSIVMPRDEAITLYKATLRESGWKMGRNHIQVCLSDCGFYSFNFIRISGGNVRVNINDFTPE